jgi:hypothetical protein
MATPGLLDSSFGRCQQSFQLLESTVQFYCCSWYLVFIAAAVGFIPCIGSNSTSIFLPVQDAIVLSFQDCPGCEQSISQPTCNATCV